MCLVRAEVLHNTHYIIMHVPSIENGQTLPLPQIPLLPRCESSGYVLRPVARRPASGPHITVEPFVLGRSSLSGPADGIHQPMMVSVQQYPCEFDPSECSFSPLLFPRCEESFRDRALRMRRGDHVASLRNSSLIGSTPTPSRKQKVGSIKFADFMAPETHPKKMRRIGAYTGDAKSPNLVTGSKIQPSTPINYTNSPRASIILDETPSTPTQSVSTWSFDSLSPPSLARGSSYMDFMIANEIESENLPLDIMLPTF